MKPVRLVPDDPALPGLVAIRSSGLARTMGRLGLGDAPSGLTLWGYSRGSRATFEAHTSRGRVAIKCYAKDPAPEAGLYLTLAGMGSRSGNANVQVPPLLAWEKDLRILVVGWLEGPSAHELIATGEGRRAGALAARWIRYAASLSLRLGAEHDAPTFLHVARKWATSLGEADPALGVSGMVVVERLKQNHERAASHVVNGRLYVRHVLDLGDATGVIDWDRFGQGPLEVDAGMFLATVWRSGQHRGRTAQAAAAESEFLARIDDLVNERRLAWHRAAALLKLTHHLMARRDGDWLARGLGLLREASSVLDTVEWGALVPVERTIAAYAGPAVTEERRLGSRLTDLQLALFRVLRARGEATIRSLMRRLDTPVDRFTVTSLLTRLRERGLVARRLAGRDVVYRATAGDRETRRSFIDDFSSLDDPFDSDIRALVCQLLQARDVNAENLARMIALVRQRELKGTTE